MPVDEEALDAFLASDGDDAVETPAPVDTPAVESDPDPLPEGDKFDRAYVEKLRKESASYRERAKKYNEAFDGYEEEAVSEWLDLANALKSDPRTAAQRFKEIYEAIESNFQEEVEELIEESDPDNPVMTRADFEQLMAQRDHEMDIQRRVVGIEAQATELGYEVGSESYEELLWHASKTKTGDIKEAHEKIQAKYQSYFDKQVAEVGGRPNPMVTDRGAPASGERSIKTFEDADKALDQWLAGL
jgi:hypothetical protein